MNFRKRTHNCGELNPTAIGKIVTLNGWVARIRDLGGLYFIDLRDRYGITQLKISPDKKEIYEIALKLRNEFVISATGKVIRRESINPNIPTGEIEIDVDELQVLNESEVLPFNIEEDVKASEELRLKYRYLDLRRRVMTKNLTIRSEVYYIVHDYFKRYNFIEVETPILMKSTPEGARDYLVPSRIHHGKFYALPQSPQTYKQILMVAGLDRYVQICKCFRDEDLRADRQPEFTQIDVEMSFITQEDIFTISEGLFKEIWKKILNIDIKIPFRRFTYDEVINLYGSDKPDLRIRNDLTIKELTEIFGKSNFNIFKNAIESGELIAGIRLKNSPEKKIEITRRVIDGYTEFVKKVGFGGLIYLKIDETGKISSPILKYLSEEEINSLLKKFAIENGDIIFILTGDRNKVLTTLGLLRNKIAEDFKLIDESGFEFIWITDFPLLKYNEEENKFEGEHHPFTSPRADHIHLLDSRDRKTLESIRAVCYDLVLNGNEIGSGSIRIHKPDVQKKIFEIIGLSHEEAEKKFGFLTEAFKYGAPPHGGIAFGYDRIIAILCGLKSIKDVIAFPKTVSATSLMDDCPSYVDDKQLKELGIKIEKKK
ncbi:MAG: aspartate--tRNA ligase [Ignavibacteria bacterium]|nr:aspartate--tRNA ligase [Ignavibacteria bacterium]